MQRRNFGDPGCSRPLRTEELTGVFRVGRAILYRDVKGLVQTGYIEQQYGRVGLARRFVSGVNFGVRETTNIVQNEATALAATAPKDDGDFLFF